MSAGSGTAREQRKAQWKLVAEACRRLGWDPYGDVTLSGPCGPVTFTPYEECVGLPSPRRTQGSGGYGLWQVTPHYRGVATDPPTVREQARAAAERYRAWERRRRG